MHGSCESRFVHVHAIHCIAIACFRRTCSHCSSLQNAWLGVLARRMDQGAVDARRAFLGSLPVSYEAAQAAVSSDGDAWWASAAAVAAVSAAPAWRASDAAALLAAAGTRTADFDRQVHEIFTSAKKEPKHGEDTIAAWIADGGDERLARLLLRRQLWHMQWLLCVPLAASRDAACGDNIGRLAHMPILFHAHSVALAGNARALRALLGAHPAVARALFPYRFRLLHTLITVGGQHAEHLCELRLLPGTHMPVQDRESGAWIDSLDTSPATRPALWVEHPLMASALALRGIGAPPAPAPVPPVSLEQWYEDLVAELGGKLGLVDHALGLARAASKVGLTPLRAAAHELEFVACLGDGWRVDSLRTAESADIVRALVRAKGAGAGALEDALRDALPFFRTGTYVDADQLRTLSDDALIVHMLLVLVDDAHTESQLLTLVERIVTGDWISIDTRRALALAVVLGWRGSERDAYAAMSSMLRALASPARYRAAPLTTLLRDTLHARPASVRELWTLLCEVEAQDVRAALDDAAAFVSLGESVHEWIPRAPRNLAASTELSERLGTTMCDAALGRDDPKAEVLRMFAALEPHFGGLVDKSAFEAILATLLRAQRYPLFHMVVSELDGAPILAAALPDGPNALVLAEARRAFCAARTCDATSGPLRRAHQSLAAAPQTPEIASELALVEAVAELGAYDIPSRDGSHALTPAEVRDTQDPLDLLARVLAVNGGAYRHSDEMMALARVLVVALPRPAAPADLDVTVLSMLVDAAMAADDLDAACTYCSRLAALAPRAPPASRDAAWRACFQLGKHPDLRDAKARAQVLGHALVLAPPENIPRVLSEYATLDDSLLVPTREMPQRGALSRLLGKQWAPRRQEPLGRAASLFDSVGSSHADRAARMARSLWDGFGTDEAPITGSLRGAMGWLMGDERS